LGEEEVVPVPDPFDPDGAISKEYYYLQDLVGRFNENCFETKKWSVALTSAAAIFSGFSGKSAIASAFLVLLLALAFWLTDAVWRSNAEAFIRRVRELEGLASGISPRISRSWARFTFGPTDPRQSSPDDGWRTDPPENRRIWTSHLWDKRTALPHAFIAGLALGWLVVALVQLLAGGQGAEPKAKAISKLEITVMSNGSAFAKEKGKR
jgi:hypothetical protein